jgi:hypothetical protein
MTMMGEEGDQRRQSDFEIVEFLDEKTMNLDEKTMMMVEEEGYQSKRFECLITTHEKRNRWVKRRIQSFGSSCLKFFISLTSRYMLKYICLVTFGLQREFE